MPSFASSWFHRVKVHFSRKYIRSHHSFVLCKYEAGVTLESIVAHQNLVEDVTPRARKPGCSSVFTRASLLVREIAAASVKLVSVIHDCGYSLDGRLTLSNLFWIPATKSLKIGGLRGKDFKKKTPLMAERDYQSLSLILTKEVFGNVPIPDELGAWLDLLRENPLSHVDLITEHMFLLEDDEKLAKYIILFQKLQQAKNVSYDIYKSALSVVSAGDSTGRFRWKAAVLQSFFLEAVKNYKPQGFYEADAEGLLLFGRHCCHHLCDSSVKTVEHRGIHTAVIVIQVSEVYSHMEAFVPGLFAQLQKAVHVIIKDLKAANLPPQGC